MFTCGATAKDMFAYILLMHLVRCWQLRFLRNRNVIQLCWCGLASYIFCNQIYKLYMYWFQTEELLKEDLKSLANFQQLSPAHSTLNPCIFPPFGSALQRPPYLKANARLDLGFTCFSLFCLEPWENSLNVMGGIRWNRFLRSSSKKGSRNNSSKFFRVDRHEFSILDGLEKPNHERHPFEGKSPWLYDLVLEDKVVFL